MKVKDLTGLRFGRLVVTSYAGQNKHKKATWKCICDCGEKIRALTASKLINQYG